MVGAEVGLGGLDGLMVEDLLEYVEWHPRVREPSRTGVAEAVAGEFGLCVPFRELTHVSALGAGTPLTFR